MAREMGRRDTKAQEEEKKTNQFWKRPTGTIRPKFERTISSLLAEQTPMAQTSLARNLADNVQKQEDLNATGGASAGGAHGQDK